MTEKKKEPPKGPRPYHADRDFGTGRRFTEVTHGEAVIVEGDIVELTLDGWGSGKIPHPERYATGKVVKVAVCVIEEDDEPEG